MVYSVYEVTTQDVCTGLVIQEPREDQIYQDTVIFLEFESSGYHHSKFLTASSAILSLAKFQITKHPFRLCLTCSFTCVLNVRTSTQLIIDARAGVRHSWAKCKDKFGDRIHAESQSDSADTCMLQFTHKI